jgi:hypothetical protein
MTCDQARPLLPLFAADDAPEIAGHLAACPVCRVEAEAFARTRAALDTLAIPEVSIDPAAVLADAAASQTRAVRRWKRIAAGATALAAGVLVVLVVRPTVRVGDGALVVRWADPPPAVVGRPQTIPARDAELAERVELMGRLVRALADEAEGRDRDRKSEIAYLKARLDLLALQADARHEATARDVGVLYRAQFVKKEAEE